MDAGESQGPECGDVHGDPAGSLSVQSCVSTSKSPSLLSVKDKNSLWAPLPGTWKNEVAQVSHCTSFRRLG